MPRQSLILSVASKAGLQRGWKLIVDGREVDFSDRVCLRNEKMGVDIELGLRPEGYDGVAIHEPGGGGSVIIPYVEAKGVLYIGLINEQRVLMGGSVWNAPRGFLDPNETHIVAAERELAEETGFKARARLFPLGGPVNSNSAFFDTHEPDEGVRFFGFSFLENEVEPDQDGLLKFRSSTVIKTVDKARSVGERIGKCRFHPLAQAWRVADGFSLIGMMRLMGYKHMAP